MPDVSLRNLCRYYLNCLSVDESGGVSVFARGRYGVDYAELDEIDLSSIAANDEIRRLAGELRKNRNMTAYLGYPVMIERRFSRRTGEGYFFVVPVLLYGVEISSGGVEVLSSVPRINMEVIKKFSFGEQDGLIYEMIRLENDLGLGDPEAEVELGELAGKLVSLKPNWAWKEKIDPDRLSTGRGIAEINEEGIYNKAVILITEKPPYVQGLERELNNLAALSEEEFMGTALYDWLHGTLETVGRDDGSINLIEVLPLNSEQEQAVRMAMGEKLTVVTGPPGTGKSQVVTDLIVNSAWRGTTLLFASKNNKAVDVVEKRVNGLGKRPILLRVGSNAYSTRLVELVQDLLSISPSGEDKSEFEHAMALYDRMVKENEKLLSEKKKYVSLRNRVDKLERETEQCRGEVGTLWKEVTKKETDCILEIIKAFEGAYSQVLRQRQPLLVRLLWPVIKPGRVREYEKFAVELSHALKVLGLKQIPLKYSETSHHEVEKSLDEARKRVQHLNALDEYRELLKQLSSCRPLEEIDREIFATKSQLSALAAKLWTKWLVVKQPAVSRTDRQTLTGMLAALRLQANDGDDEDGLLYSRESREILRNIREKLSRYIPCWAVTSLSAGGWVPFKPGYYDLLVIDEASQCDIASALPLLYRAKRAVIIGDPKQLSHITGLSSVQDRNLLSKYSVPLEYSYKAISLFDLARSLASPENIVDLRDHHRSHADIIGFSNKEFYNDRLRIATRYNELVLPVKESPGVRWVHVSGSVSRPEGGSAVNKAEAEALVEQIRHLALVDGYRGSIGAVTPFRAQAEYINEIIDRDNKLRERLQTVNDFMADTVHKFQGDERDVMFFSPVVSKGMTQGAHGFLNSTGNLFNVAITRARAMLIVVGDREACLGCGIKYLEHFAEYVASLESRAVSEAFEITDFGPEYPDVYDSDKVSEWEKVLYAALYREGIVTVPQYRVEKYRLDLALFDGDRRLDIEVDGEMYHRDWNGELCYRDQLRNHRLFELGWDVMRFWVYQVRDDIGWCVKKVREWKENGKAHVSYPK